MNKTKRKSLPSNHYNAILLQFISEKAQNDLLIKKKAVSLQPLFENKIQ